MAAASSVNPSPSPGLWRRAWRAFWRPVLAAGLLVGLGSALAATWLILATHQQDQGNDLLRAELKGLEAPLKELAALRPQLAQALALQADEPLWAVQRQWPARLLQLLVGARPVGLLFDELRETDDGLQISGHARNYAELLQLAEALTRSGLLQQLDVGLLRPDPAASAAAGGGLVFRLDARVGKSLRPQHRPDWPLRVGGATGDPP